LQHILYTRKEILIFTRLQMRELANPANPEAYFEFKHRKN
jgi:hypothetical protein